MKPDYINRRTVGELIAVLQQYPPTTPVRALAASSLTAYPLYVVECGDGAVELIGDEQA